MAALYRGRDLLGHGLRRRRLRPACHGPASRDLLDPSRNRRSRRRTVTSRTATTETSCHETLFRTRRSYLPDVLGNRPPLGQLALERRVVLPASEALVEAPRSQ